MIDSSLKHIGTYDSGSYGCLCEYGGYWYCLNKDNVFQDGRGFIVVPKSMGQGKGFVFKTYTGPITPLKEEDD